MTVKCLLFFYYNFHHALFILLSCLVSLLELITDDLFLALPSCTLVHHCAVPTHSFKQPAAALLHSTIVCTTTLSPGLSLAPSFKPLHTHTPPPLTQHVMTSFVQPVPQPPLCSFSDFELGRYVHAGGYGTVYSATRKADGKRVALVSGVDPATLSLTHSIYCTHSLNHTNSQFYTAYSKARF
jgi:hypothetical protein